MNENLSFNPSEFVEGGNALVPIVAEDNGFVVELTNRKMSFCSLHATDMESKKILFKAANNPEKRISDEINEIILIKDVYCEEVDCKNAETGEVNRCPRIVLIDDKGVGHQAVSLGVFGAVKKLFAIFGVPTYDEPIAVKVKQITKGKNKLTTLDIV